MSTTVNYIKLFDLLFCARLYSNAEKTFQINSESSFTDQDKNDGHFCKN